MAITIDYLDPAQFIINIPRLDMVDVTGGSPTEIRQLNIDSFRSTLGDLQDDAIGSWAVTAFEHTAPLTVAGVTLARVVEILDPYVIEFEDGAYNVNIVGGNSNISDVTIKNTVGVNTANSAGLQDPFALQAAAFGGRIAIDITSAFAGTSFPIGTRSSPVNNIADAIAIAELRGYRDIIILSDMTMGSGDFSDGYAFYGDSPVVLTLTLDPAANVINCSFNNMTIQGTLDGMNNLTNCHTNNINFFNGDMHFCAIQGTITLGGGVQADIIDCFSGIAGGGVGQTPTIDMGGSGNDLILRAYSGGMAFINATGSLDASMDFTSGRAVFDATVADGNFTIRGIADVEDSSTGSAVINDLTLNASNVTTAIIEKLLRNKSITDPDTGIMTVYEADGTTPFLTAQIYEDVAALQAYRGQGIEHRDRLA
jgi:hypothetical protein